MTKIVQSGGQPSPPPTTRLQSSVACSFRNLRAARGSILSGDRTIPHPNFPLLSCPIRQALMENDHTFVAPEGVYSNVEEHKPTPYNAHIVFPTTYPTRLSSIVIRYPLSKPGSSQGITHWQILGGGKDKDKEKEVKNREKEQFQQQQKEREDGQSLSSSEKPGTDDLEEPESIGSPLLHPQSPIFESTKLFGSTTIGMGKKKPTSRPRHNIRTTTSTFVTRLQSIENLNKILQNKQGDINYLFYNSGKSFFWTELGVKAKVR